MVAESRIILGLIAVAFLLTGSCTSVAPMTSTPIDQVDATATEDLPTITPADKVEHPFAQTSQPPPTRTPTSTPSSLPQPSEIPSPTVLATPPLPSLPTSTPPAENDSPTRHEYTELLDKVAAEGHIHVIVTLSLPTGPFQPEGYLSQEEIQQQRQAIVATTEALLSSLEGHDAVIYATWEGVPSVGLIVDEAALMQLIASPHAMSIQEDSPDLPQSTGAAG